MSVAPISPVSWPQLPEMRTQAPSGGGEGFQAAMKDALGTVNQLGQESARITERFLNGEGEEIHSVIMADQKASISFDLFLQVRNKVVQAYQEVMRMQV